MNVSPPIQRVVDRLVLAGYRRVEPPITIAGLPFDFPALLVGTEHSQELVAVLDMVTAESDGRVRQQVEALARALDLVASRRPLTAVLVGPRPRTQVVETLARVSRVLFVPVTRADASDAVEDALAVLLPLRLPHVEDHAADPLGQINARLTQDESEELAALLSASARGGKAVEQAFAGWLSGAFERSGETD